MKYEFGSPPWLAALHAIFCERAAALAAKGVKFSYSMCEVYMDAPPQIANIPGGKAVWYVKIDGPNVVFELIERDDVDFKAVGDYAALKMLGRFDTMHSEQRMSELMSIVQQLIGSGKLKLIGTPLGVSGPLGSIHDAMAPLTA